VRRYRSYLSYRSRAWCWVIPAWNYSYSDRYYWYDGAGPMGWSNSACSLTCRSQRSTWPRSSGGWWGPWPHSVVSCHHWVNWVPRWCYRLMSSPGTCSRGTVGYLELIRALLKDAVSPTPIDGWYGEAGRSDIHNPIDFVMLCYMFLLPMINM
jgi:hypothetical protein